MKSQLALETESAETVKRASVSRRVGRVSVLPLCLASVGTDVLAGSDRLLEALVALEQTCQVLCSPSREDIELRERIDELAVECRSSGDLPDRGPERVAALNRFVFERLGIKPSGDLKNPDNLFPSRILERKEGYCVGIAGLYLALAGRLDLPIFAVATPAHVFLRYDDGATRINIETFQRGAHVPDEQYVRDQRIPEESIRKGVFMRNLTGDQFLAQVHNNLGVIHSERKAYEQAAREYLLAAEQNPRFPAACYNFGNDLLAQGQHRRAIRMFSRALRLYPTDVWALNNRGVAYLKVGKQEKATRDFEEALGIDAGFEAARANLARLREGRDAVREP